MPRPRCCGSPPAVPTASADGAWAWLSAGTGAWAAGQAVWSYYEVVLDREVPFPSLADVGFLLFPLAAAVGLVIWLGTQSDQLVARGRDLLDGADHRRLAAGDLLGHRARAPWWPTAATRWFPLTLSLAYPVGDLILATLVLLALARGHAPSAATLAVLALGLGGLAVADSAYVYLVSLGAVLLGRPGQQRLGDRLPVRRRGRDDRAARRPTTRPAAAGTPGRTPCRGPSVLRLALPYVPLLGAVGGADRHLLTGARTPTVTCCSGASLS